MQESVVYSRTSFHFGDPMLMERTGDKSPGKELGPLKGNIQCMNELEKYSPLQVEIARKLAVNVRLREKIFFGEFLTISWYKFVTQILPA